MVLTMTIVNGDYGPIYTLRAPHCSYPWVAWTAPKYPWEYLVTWTLTGAISEDVCGQLLGHLLMSHDLRIDLLNWNWSCCLLAAFWNKHVQGCGYCCGYGEVWEVNVSRGSKEVERANQNRQKHRQTQQHHGKETQRNKETMSVELPDGNYYQRITT